MQSAVGNFRLVLSHLTLSLFLQKVDGSNLQAAGFLPSRNKENPDEDKNVNSVLKLNIYYSLLVIAIAKC